jgi:hypothetical protein
MFPAILPNVIIKCAPSEDYLYKQPEYPIDAYLS